jgi:type I restriction enzyme S subunit
MEWQSKKLIDISQVSTGKWDANHATEAGNYKFFTCAYDSFLCDTKRFEGECLILPGNGVNVGEVFYYAGEFDAYQRTYVISDIQINSKYLFYHMKCFWKQRNLNKQYGSATNYLKIGNFNDYEVSFPPIPEQKRIVALLDTVFADLEQTRAKTEQNLKNARELFDSYLQQVFNRGGFEKVKLGDEIELLTGFAFKSKEYVTHENSIPLIRGDNIVQGQLRWDGVKLWPTERLVEFEKYELAEDDIVLAMDRTWVKAGIKVAKIAKEDLPALLVQRVARLRSKSSLHPDFLYYLIRSKFFESHVLSIQTGLGVPHISGKQIQSFTFNKPSFNEQLQLIKKMNMLSSQVLSLEAVYRCKINYLDELKKSILQKAFSGELTAKAE